MYKEKATLVFDIETIPDIAKAKQFYQLDNLSDAEAFEALKNMRRQETGGSDFFFGLKPCANHCCAFTISACRTSSTCCR